MNILTNKRLQLLSSAALFFVPMMSNAPASAMEAVSPLQDGILAEEQSSPEETEPDLKQAELLLESMSLEKKISQMFILTPEMLTGAGTVIQAGETTRSALEQYPVGGLIYMSQNIVTEEQFTAMARDIQSYSLELTSLPLFLCVDEEGGAVRRVSGNLPLIPEVPDMRSVGQSGDLEEAYETGALIGSYLGHLGFNVDFAPVADVVTDPKASAISDRSFGSNPLVVGNMAAACARGIREQGVYATLKHFPGHGAVEEDSHLSGVISQKTLIQLKTEDLIPFMIGISEGTDFIMAGHISFPNITDDHVPASLSHYFLTDLLRDEMGYTGLIVTDALNMGAVIDFYSPGEAAVMAVSAGADLLLMPEDFKAAHQSIVEAVRRGEISEERIDESVRRIIALKLTVEPGKEGA